MIISVRFDVGKAKAYANSRSLLQWPFITLYNIVLDRAQVYSHNAFNRLFAGKKYLRLPLVRWCLQTKKLAAIMRRRRRPG